MRKYYEAYDDRYAQVHERNLQWSSDAPSAIVYRVLEQYGIGRDDTILELGCGEGRDAMNLLREGYDITATDISPEAIRFCRSRCPEFADSFQVLDCIGGKLDGEFDFIYGVALIHMLVEDQDRAACYRFIRDHLKENGSALICTMGDGTVERKSDISTAFDLQERTHSQIGMKMLLSATSCRMVNWDMFLREIRENGLTVAEYGLTEVPPDFPVMMYALIRT